MAAFEFSPPRGNVGVHASLRDWDGQMTNLFIDNAQLDDQLAAETSWVGASMQDALHLFDTEPSVPSLTSPDAPEPAAGSGSGGMAPPVLQHVLPPPQPLPALANPPSADAADPGWSAQLAELALRGAPPAAVLALTTSKLTGYALSPPASPGMHSRLPPPTSPNQMSPNASATTTLPAGFLGLVNGGLSMLAGPNVYHTESTFAHSPSPSPSAAQHDYAHSYTMAGHGGINDTRPTRDSRRRTGSSAGGASAGVGAALVVDADRLMHQMSALEAQNAEATKRINELQSSLEEARLRTDRQLAAEQGLKDTIDDLEQRAKARDHQLEVTQRQVDVLQSELHGARGELAVERNQTASLRDELDTWKGECHALKKDMDEVQRKMGTWGMEERRLQAEVQSLRRDRDTLTDMLAKNRVEAQEARDRLRMLQAELEGKHVQVARAEAGNENVMSQLILLRNKVTELELKNSQLSYEVIAAREEASKTRIEMEARALRSLQYDYRKAAGRPTVDLDAAPPGSWMVQSDAPPPAMPAPYAMSYSPMDKPQANKAPPPDGLRSFQPSTLSRLDAPSGLPPSRPSDTQMPAAGYTRPSQPPINTTFLSTEPIGPSAPQHKLGTSSQAYGQAFAAAGSRVPNKDSPSKVAGSYTSEVLRQAFSRSELPSTSTYSPALPAPGPGAFSWSSAPAQPSADASEVRRSLVYGSNELQRGGADVQASTGPSSRNWDAPQAPPASAKPANSPGLDVPYGTERTLKELLQRSQAMEDRLVTLCQEKGQLEAEYAKMPLHGGRNARERTRKSEVEQRIDTINREVSGLRLTLKKLHGK